jgi:hypothetical protein
LENRREEIPRNRQGDNIKLDLREIMCEGADLIQLTLVRAQQRTVVNTVMNVWLSYAAGNFLISQVTIRFSLRAVLYGVS